MTKNAPHADAVLIRLGRQFEEARKRETAACADVSEAEQAARDEHTVATLDRAANEAGKAAAALAARIAGLPARTAEGFRVKLRALAHYNPDALPSEIPDQPDPDQILAHSLWVDMQGEPPPFEI
ncbi:hypothetical protein MKK84_27945 [Methylobacterium sp. E-065]|uniref:hypothetical protein n=1 Tax=Methylobacterium sp. E-065 TaxID=2836583 RepID=UPI001FB861ED|nr:hypothetical protein [Methylobacterium sp. E-065]MCJ2021204.1 hypothetical protein [Methylobacterium sp. E-065]